MSKPGLIAKENQDKLLDEKEKTKKLEEIEARLKKLGLKSPGYVRGMMDDLSDISIIFLE